jgi:hypothetical protein
MVFQGESLHLASSFTYSGKFQITVERLWSLCRTLCSHILTYRKWESRGQVFSRTMNSLQAIDESAPWLLFSLSRKLHSIIRDMRSFLKNWISQKEMTSSSFQASLPTIVRIFWRKRKIDLTSFTYLLPFLLTSENYHYGKTPFVTILTLKNHLAKMGRFLLTRKWTLIFLSKWKQFFTFFQK